MFLTEDDYKFLITDDDRDVVEQSEETNRTKAEASAIAYFKGYLRGRYDVEALFALTGDNRPAELVLFLMDEVLYTLHSTLPGNMVPEIRQLRKENLDKWLLNIQKGIVQPDFGLITDEDGNTDLGNPVKYGGNKKLGSTW